MTSDNETRDEPTIFSAVLTPHRSLGSTGFLLLMLVFGGASFVTGVVFILLGAWPVLYSVSQEKPWVITSRWLNWRWGLFALHGLAGTGPVGLDFLELSCGLQQRLRFDFTGRRRVLRRASVGLGCIRHSLTSVRAPRRTTAGNSEKLPNFHTDSAFKYG